jgi:hypothetical protein
VERKMEYNTVSRRTEIAYKAEEADEVAQQTKVRGNASTVNAAVVQLKFAFLSGEACGTCAPTTESAGLSNKAGDAAGVSRRRSTDDLSGRPERKERASPRCGLEPSMMPSGGEDEGKGSRKGKGVRKGRKSRKGSVRLIRNFVFQIP